MRTPGVIADLDGEGVLVDADAGQVLAVLGDQRDQQITLRDGRLWVDDGFTQKCGATPGADIRQIRPGDSAVAVDRMAPGAAAFAAEYLCPMRGVAGHGLYRNPSQRSHVGGGLAHLMIRHGTGAGHFGAANTFLDDLEERRVVRRVRQLRLSEQWSAPALAFRSVAQRAMHREELLAASD